MTRLIYLEFVALFGEKFAGAILNDKCKTY